MAHTDDTVLYSIDSVLYKHLNHETTEAEERWLYAWLEEREEHRTFYFEIAAIWSAHKTLSSKQLGERCDAMMRRLNARIDADDAMRNSWAFIIDGEGWDVATYPDALTFLSMGNWQRPGCILLDVRMPHMSGLELQFKLREIGCDLPIIFISGHGDIDMAVHTLKHGAMDFLTKPVSDQRLLEAIETAVSRNLAHRRNNEQVANFRARLEQLTQREREVIRMVAHGYSNKEVAREFGISEKTVQVHRGSAYRKLNIHNAAEIARLLILSGDPI